MTTMTQTILHKAAPFTARPKCSALTKEVPKLPVWTNSPSYHRFYIRLILWCEEAQLILSFLKLVPNVMARVMFPNFHCSKVWKGQRRLFQVHWTFNFTQTVPILLKVAYQFNNSCRLLQRLSTTDLWLNVWLKTIKCNTPTTWLRRFWWMRNHVKFLSFHESVLRKKTNHHLTISALTKKHHSTTPHAVGQNRIQRTDPTVNVLDQLFGVKQTLPRLWQTEDPSKQFPSWPSSAFCNVCKDWELYAVNCVCALFVPPFYCTHIWPRDVDVVNGCPFWQVSKVEIKQSCHSSLTKN